MKYCPLEEDLEALNAHLIDINLPLFQRLFVFAIQSLKCIFFLYIYIYFFYEFIYEACWVVLLLIILNIFLFLFFLFFLCDVLCLLYDAATLPELPLVGLIKLLT